LTLDILTSDISNCMFYFYIHTNKNTLTISVFLLTLAQKKLILCP